MTELTGKVGALTTKLASIEGDLHESEHGRKEAAVRMKNELAAAAVLLTAI